MTEKVYTPEIVPDVGFPQSSEGVASTVTQPGSGGVSTPKKTPEVPFPQKMVAKELLSTVFNTVSKKILGAFEFAKSGAIQIGEYIAGVSGDIRISPKGIVARNKAGATTFALDGETGDGTFQGTIRASKFQSDYFNVDERGNVEANSIIISSASDNSSGIGGYQEVTTLNTNVDVTNATLTFTLERPTILLILAYLGGIMQQNGTGNFEGRIYYRTFLDSDQIEETSTFGTYNSTTGVVRGVADYNNVVQIYSIRKIPAGTHTIKLVLMLDDVVGTPKFTVDYGKINYVTLGNY